MGSYWFVLIKIYYISATRYCVCQIISWIMLLYFKIIQRMRRNQKFLFQLAYSLITVCLVYRITYQGICSFVISFNFQFFEWHLSSICQNIRETWLFSLYLSFACLIWFVLLLKTVRLFHEFLHQLLKLLLLILVISSLFLPNVWAHFSSIPTQLSLIIWEVYQEIHLNLSFWLIKSFAILKPLIMYL